MAQSDDRRTLSMMVIGRRALLLLVFSLAVLWFVAGLTLGCDEPQTANIVQFCSWTDILAHHYRESNPPLIYVILKLWATVFSASDLSLKACVILITAILTPALYLIFREQIGEPASISLALLSALCVSLVGEGQLVRSYGLTVLLDVLATYLLSQIIRSSALRRSGVAYCLIVAAMMYTHLLSAIVLAGHALVIAYALVRRQLEPRRLTVWMISCAAAVLLFLPQLITLASTAVADGLPWRQGVSLPTLLVALPVFSLATAPSRSSPAMLFVTATIFWAALLIVILSRNWLRTRMPAFDFNTWVGVLLGMLFGEMLVSAIVIRQSYAIQFVPWVLLFVVLSSYRVCARLPASVSAILPFLLLLPIWVPGLLHMHGHRQSGIAQTCQLINDMEARAPGQRALVMISREWLAPGAYRYLAGEIPFVCFPDLERIDVIPYFGILGRTRNEEKYNNALAILHERLSRGDNVYHLYSKPRLAAQPEVPIEELDYNHLEELRSVQIQSWLQNHAKLEQCWRWPDCAGELILCRFASKSSGDVPAEKESRL